EQNVLILNQTPFQCPANQCGSLFSLLQKSIPFRHIEERNARISLPEVSFIPDLIVLRLSLGDSAQKLIASCKRIWSYAKILALFCLGSNKPIDFLPCDFDAVDDFVSCPFWQGELTLRIKRLLHLKSAIKTSSDLPEEKRKLHPVSIVGESPCFLRVIEQIPLLSDCQATVL